MSYCKIYESRDEEDEEDEEIRNCYNNLCELIKPKNHHTKLLKFLKMLSKEMPKNYFIDILNPKKTYYLFYEPDDHPMWLTIRSSSVEKFNMLYKYGSKIENINEFLRVCMYSGTTFNYIINIFEKFDKKIDYDKLLFHCRNSKRKELIIYIFREKCIFINEKRIGLDLIYPIELNKDLTSKIVDSTPNNELSTDVINIITSYITGS